MRSSPWPPGASRTEGCWLAPVQLDVAAVCVSFNAHAPPVAQSAVLHAVGHKLPESECHRLHRSVGQAHRWHIPEVQSRTFAIGFEQCGYEVSEALVGTGIENEALRLG